jgi:serine/threonine-protein kinase
MTIMITPTAKSFVNLLRASALLAPEQVARVKHEVGQLDDSRLLAKRLVRRGWLTVYQINQLFQGHARDLILGPYRILDALGEGAVARVFRAWHTQEHRLLALKVIRQECMANPEAVRQFRQEAKAIAQLAHPNVVKTFEFGQVGEICYLAMELVEGIDLARLVRLSGPLPIAQACDYIRQAAEGLQHAHVQGLIHRDVKPANLVVVSAPALHLFAPEQDRRPLRKSMTGNLVKILDWGLTDLRLALPAGQSQKQSDEGLGTADYLPPEQAIDPMAVDARADLYALGCTMYYLLTAQPPFPDGSLLQKLMKHREADPPPLGSFRSDVPLALADLSLRLLAKNPADRPDSAAQVARLLRG